ncbi:MAG: hypothetical protein EU539_11840 [Promethearchaeota archaeon]|nr:MAG: hypothetical protein EU539_11840 [Candidatus Lokiarchaeota archaeon]
MSIHGNQYLMPFFLGKDPNSPQLEENDELALVFYLLTKDLENVKILSFSKLLWPLLSIQGIISTHVILDGLKIFSKKGKFSNPPRQPLIGHILRNVEDRSQIELLKRIIDVLTYQDKEAEEIGSGEESEFQTLFIEGLINPEHLNSLIKLIPHIDYLPITEYAPLDTGLTTENALDLSEQYRNTIETMKGNSLRWKTQIQLIENEVNKWLTNITAQLKDVELRFSSQLSKTSSIIDNDQVKEQLKIENDKIDQWKVNEKKKIIENITVLFKTAERNLHEMVKKTRFFTQEEYLRSKIFEDLVLPFEEHFDYMRKEGKAFLENIESLYKKFEDFKEQSHKIDAEAEDRLKRVEEELQIQLKDRDNQLTIIEKEKGEKINILKDWQKDIENLFHKIKEIIQNKVDNCLQEAKDLTNWSIKDTQDELFSKPIQWIYMPLYAMFVEDKDSMEEKIYFLFPGYIGGINSLYEYISDSFITLKYMLNEKLEEDMKIRSNFEFTIESKNLIKDPNFDKKIQMGMSILRNKGLVNDLIESQIRAKLNLLS